MLRMYTSLTGIMSYLRVRACVYVCVCLMLSACQHLYPPTPPFHFQVSARCDQAEAGHSGRKSIENRQPSIQPCV